MKNLFQKLRVVRAFVALVKNPGKTEKIFEISDSLRERNREQAVTALKGILENSEFQALYLERYDPQIEIETLRRLPDDSFGRSVAGFLDGNGFTPNGFPKVQAGAPLDYLVSRLRGTHDLWHVLTGYGTDVAGELALQAFTLAQVRSAFSAMILAGGLLHVMIFRPFEAADVFERMVEGYQRGKRSRNLLTVKLENYWDRSLESVRGEWGLARA